MLLLNVTVHQNQLCENILDEVRFAFTDDAGTRRPIVAPLLVLSELKGNTSDFCPTSRAYGTRHPDYLCTLKRYVRNVDMAGDLSISPNKSGSVCVCTCVCKF